MLPWRIERVAGMRVLDPRPMLLALLEALGAGVPAATLAARFQRTITEATRELVAEARLATGVDDVCLSGGVFQNAWLADTLLDGSGTGRISGIHQRTRPRQRRRYQLRTGRHRGGTARLTGTAQTGRRASDMCLGIPGKVIEIHDQDGLRMGRVDFGGVRKEACLAYQPDVELGDYVDHPRRVRHQPGR